MSSERVITSSELLIVLDELMDDKPEGFGYKDVYKAVKGDEWFNGTCQNWTASAEDWKAHGCPSDGDYTGERIPMCIIGQALSKMDLLDKVGRYDAWSSVVQNFKKVGIVFTDEAIRAMHVAQSMQDSGASWGFSIRAARLAIDAQLNVERARRDADYEKAYSDKEHTPEDDLY